MHEPEVLYAVVQFDGTAQRAVRRVVAPFPDRSSAALFATDNGLHNYTVGPMSFAVPTRAAPAHHGIPAPRAGSF
ncbi:hypothetical protein [Candidatus Protofrankia californiensis]|uniref:hypothetical protein n=1 Tax=Candidatus Protofrankia californiensis TaxID=1839754 RepID=UPI00104171E7|nr:hypothetical protein [Candidatus Protofrankia californiensis]